MKVRNYILIITVCIHLVLALTLYKYYSREFYNKKTQILTEYTNKVAEIVLDNINLLSNKTGAGLSDISIILDYYKIQIYTDSGVSSYSNIGLGTKVDNYIPKDVFYKIEINKHFIYSNTNNKNYQIKKSYNINKSNHLDVSLGLSNLAKLESDIMKPFWSIMAYFIFNILVIYTILNLIIKLLKKKYSNYYNDYYERKISSLISVYESTLQETENSFMKKIWNLDFQKQKDLEFNCLFAKMANQISLGSDKTKMSRLNNSINQIPCSIVLYQEGELEEINITEMVELLLDRFADYEDKINIQIINKTQVVYFSSKAAIYQIMYSIINYLFYILKRQKAEGVMMLTIEDNGFKFEYDGFMISNEKELAKVGNNFFSTHANTFFLSITQALKVLKDSGYVYSFDYNQRNVINILQQEGRVKNAELLAYCGEIND